MFQRILPALLFSAAALSLVACGSTAAPTSAANTLYMNSTIGSGSAAYTQITGYASTSTTGTAAVTSTLTGPAGSPFDDFALDTNGNIYALSSVLNSTTYLTKVFVYSAGSTGTATPTRTITTTLTAQAFGIAADAAGNVYVADVSSTLQKYAANANGAATPTVSFTTALYCGDLATDSAGNLYCGAANSVSSAIYEYAAGFTANTPTRTITPATPLVVEGIAIDAAGNIVVSGSAITNGIPQIDVFSTTAGAAAVPARQITGVLTTLVSGGSGPHPLIPTYNNQNYGIALDSTGNAYVRDFVTATVIDRFGPTASGNVAPDAIITTALPNSSGANYSIAIH